MDKLYALKDRLIKELEEYAEKPFTASSFDIVQKAASAAKNLCKLIRMCEEDEEGYSGRGYDPMGRDVEPGRDMSYRGGSYARGRRNAPRDAMGRYSGETGYSRHGDIASQIHELMEHASDEQTRRELERIAQRMER
jgi:hypothetical protein